ncbi:MAG: DUF2007 domain-containing protein [Planctomycetes bacterium]|nr:DUF2007 domain-containing protein [Planctomycetota bacterium]
MYDGFELFGEYSTAWQAHLVKNLLEENGIQVVLQNPNMAAVLPIPSLYMKIYVPNVDLEKALELLENHQIGEEINGDEFEEFAENMGNDAKIVAEVDDKFDPAKAYLCANCKDTYLKKTDTPYGMKFLYSMNYIVLLMQIVARFGVLNETEFTENFKFFLILNIIIMIIHIFSILTSRFQCEKCGYSERH